MTQNDLSMVLLDQFSTNLIMQAQEGKLELVTTCDNEIEMLAEMLCVRDTNVVLISNNKLNGIAIVEGVAQRICSRNINVALRHKQIRQLDLGTLVYRFQYPKFDELLVRLIEQLSLSNSIVFV